MTANVHAVLTKIKNDLLFDEALFFVGGTALAYYLDHRISEDIDIVSATTLEHKAILTHMQSYNAHKVKDESFTALRMAGLFPDDYMMKFIVDDVKVEFFQASRPIQKEILANATFCMYEDSKLKVLDLKSIAKLKLVALLLRDKSRDFFDFGAVLEKEVLSLSEIIEVASQTHQIHTQEELYRFLETKKEPRDDESVYLSEDSSTFLPFYEIKHEVLEKLKLLKQ